MEIDDALRSKSNKDNRKLFEVIEDWIEYCVLAKTIPMVDVGCKEIEITTPDDMLKYIKENKIIE